MFSINREYVDRKTYDERIKTYQSIEYLQNPSGCSYAICIQSVLDTIALVLYFKEHGASVMLVRVDTPLQTVMRLAEKAGCRIVIYDEIDQFHLIAEGEVSLSREAPSLLQFSSGTTGEPKLIERTWQSIDHEISSYNEAIQLDKAEVPIVLSSVTHSYGLLCGVLAAFQRGAEPIIVTAANPKLTLSVIRQLPAHIVYGVPAQLRMLDEMTGKRTLFHRLMTSGMPIPPGVFDELRQRTAFMMQQYGCSEAGCISISSQMDSHLDLGFALNHYQVTAGTDIEHPGEIVVRQSETIIHTADLGYMTTAGGLRYVSRMDDVINVSGLKVFPLEVEQIIVQMPGVVESVVFRGIHPVMGEQVLCHVVADSQLTPDMIREWCIQQLPTYQVPAHISCVNNIPKSPTGKISRTQLEKEVTFR
ncbi:AMP-binding protein [Paenibacillus sp. UMB4589-SE434]|uniref:AMP-binding protein n=1 Tax=Paenibacillus sp. UMB4589-SE434 TaxID=3046314 RepID=UPI0025507AAA|nr:AMP-binding protein [Paenibacillus sp. UMB4589-SE434]MDK8180591.1 AMP-binding protein [Paenibacillus sp. UMB4589-SE434]